MICGFWGVCVAFWWFLGFGFRVWVGVGSCGGFAGFCGFSSLGWLGLMRFASCYSCGRVLGFQGLV